MSDCFREATERTGWQREGHRPRSHAVGNSCDAMTGRTAHLAEQAGLQIGDDGINRVSADDERAPPGGGEGEQ
jgi:hypothetical protein